MLLLLLASATSSSSSARREATPLPLHPLFPCTASDEAKKKPQPIFLPRKDRGRGTLGRGLGLRKRRDELQKEIQREWRTGQSRELERGGGVLGKRR